MEKLFKLQQNGTSVRTELVAGLTTFMTMAYIIALNPNLLTNFAVGTPLWNGVFLAAIREVSMSFKSQFVPSLEILSLIILINSSFVFG